MKRKAQFDQGAGVRRIARERVGTVPASKVIVPKLKRKPKHQKQQEEEYGI